MQRILRRHFVQRTHGPPSEGTARGGEDEALQLVRPSSMQALMDGVVLAVDREDGHAPSFGRLHDETAGHHEHFLVRERNGFPGLDSGQHGIEGGGSRRSTQDEIHLWIGGYRDESLPAHAHDINAGVVRGAQGPPRGGERTCRGQGDRARPEALNLSDEEADVFASSQPDDLQPAGMRLHHRQRAAADRTGGPEDGDAFQEASLVPNPESRIPIRDCTPRPCSTAALRTAGRRSDPAPRRGRGSSPTCLSHQRFA